MKTRNLILLLALAAGFAILLVDLLSNASEFADFKHAQETGREVHVIGRWVRREEAVFKPEESYYRFYMQDTMNQVAPVVYRRGTLGDLSQAEKIDVVGKWENGEFVASKIHLKCPSKYNDAASPGKSIPHE
ncbi:MAG: cytochrome c maturation protein CcmE [Bacteroidetes bacterium]|nr:cytochrome c maturation protein CcmE [Bacteroidota bacterium]